jgi:hypothetical protein
MRKSILLIILCALSFTGGAQEKYSEDIAGITIEAVEYQGGADELSEYYEKWLRVEEDRYMMFFKQTPVGYKHCLDRVNDLLDINNLSFDDDRINESILIHPICDGVYDYHCLTPRLRMGDAEVVIVWETKDGDGIFMGCNEEGFALGIGRLGDQTEIKKSNASKKQQSDQLEREGKAAEEKARQEREAKKKQLDDLMGGLNNAEGAGDKGQPDGDPYANTYYGSPGTGSGTGGYGLSGRSLANRGKVQQECNEEGRVVVRIMVDRNGKVIDAQAGVRGTTNNHPCLLEPARKTAFLHSWNPDSKAPSQQIGFVVVNFKIEN